jgi:hypothetical protein
MAGMIPGLSSMMGGMDDEEGGTKLKRMIYIRDVRVRWFDHRCKVNSDEFDRVQKRTGGGFLSEVAG